MTFEEKTTWVSGLVTLIAVGWYASVIVGQIGQGPVEAIAYQRPLLVAVGAMIVLTIVASIAMAIGSAIGSAIGGAIGGAIRAEVGGEGSVEDVGRTDERDAAIEARGDRVGYYVLASLMVGALALAMLEQPHFWIANAMFASFVVASIVGTVVKLASYRRGF